MNLMHWTTIASIEGFGDPNHYLTKLSTGNAQTIPSETSQQVESVRGALLAFHRKHYRPDNLTIVVAGPRNP